MDAEVGALVGLAGRLVVVDSLGERIWRHVAGDLPLLAPLRVPIEIGAGWAT